jgi:beta-alanine degradation protein BauB
MANEPTGQVGTRLLFENDRVRVWDLALAPGESCPEHLHRLDYFYIVESGGLIRFDDPDAPEGHRNVQFIDDHVAFRDVGPDGKIDHRLTNVGTKRHRNYVIELK